MQLSYEVAVVGGGIIGATIAAALVEAGVRVILIDAGCCGGLGASRYSEGIVRLYDPDTDIMALAAFSQECLETTGFGRVFGPSIDRTGVVYMAAPDEEAAMLDAARRLSSPAYPMRLLTGAEVRRVSRFVDHRPDRAVLHEAGGGPSDVRGAVRSMVRLARGGGTVLENTRVCRVTPEGEGVRLSLGQGTGTIHARVAVVAGGAWTAALLPQLGLQTRTIPLVRLFASEPLAMPVIDTMAGTFAVPLSGHLLHVGSQVRHAAPTPDDLGPPPGDERADALRRLAVMTGRREDGPTFDVLPGLDSYAPDGRPVVGFLDGGPCYVAAGLAGIGYKLAPGIAFHAARQIARRLGRPVAEAGTALAPFAPDRLPRVAAPVLQEAGHGR